MNLQIYLFTYKIIYTHNVKIERPRHTRLLKFQDRPALLQRQVEFDSRRAGHRSRPAHELRQAGMASAVVSSCSTHPVGRFLTLLESTPLLRPIVHLGSEIRGGNGACRFFHPNQSRASHALQAPTSFRQHKKKGLPQSNHNNNSYLNILEQF
jgi:hypothetical protein